MERVLTWSHFEFNIISATSSWALGKPFSLSEPRFSQLDKNNNVLEIEELVYRNLSVTLSHRIILRFSEK